MNSDDYIFAKMRLERVLSRSDAALLWKKGKQPSRGLQAKFKWDIKLQSKKLIKPKFLPKMGPFLHGLGFHFLSTAVIVAPRGPKKASLEPFCQIGGKATGESGRNFEPEISFEFYRKWQSHEHQTSSTFAKNLSQYLALYLDIQLRKNKDIFNVLD